MHNIGGCQHLTKVFRQLAMAAALNSEVQLHHGVIFSSNWVWLWQYALFSVLDYSNHTVCRQLPCMRLATTKALTSSVTVTVNPSEESRQGKPWESQGLHVSVYRAVSYNTVL